MRESIWLCLILGAHLLLFSPSAFAAVSFTYQGRIINTNNQPIVAQTVNFTLQILAPDGVCVLYAESNSADMSSGDGGFSLKVGGGQRIGTGGVDLEKLFDSNLVYAPTAECPSGYTRQSNEELLLSVSFNDGTGLQTLAPIEITSVPQAMDTKGVAGVDSRNVLRVSNTAATPLSAADYAEFLALINGTSTHYLTASGGSGTIGGATIINTSGNISSSGNVSGNSITTNTLKIYNAATPVTIVAPVNSGYKLTLPVDDGLNGQVLATDGSGNLSWSTAGAGGVASVTAAGTPGNPVVVGGTVTNPTIALPPATSSNNGYLSSSDWTTFNSKMGAVAGSSLNSGQIWVGNSSNQATAVTPSSDVSLSDSGAFTVSKLQNRTLASTAPSIGTLLKWNVGSTQWEPCSTPFRVTSSSGNAAFSIGESATSNGMLYVYDSAGTTGVLLRAGTSNSYINAGNFGIGTTSPDEKLVVDNGSTTGKYTATCWTHSSDRRLKHSLSPLNDSLTKILKLQGVSYVFNNDIEGKQQIGFIAQDVETVYPEVVVTDDKGFKSMVYANLVAPIVESIKSLYQRIVGLESQQKEAQSEIEALRRENARIIEQNKKISTENEQIKLWVCTKDPSAPFCQ